MIITSSTMPAQETFKFNWAGLYLWKIVNPELLIPFIPNYKENLDLIKFGFAHFTRVYQEELHDGIIIRIRETLRDMEFAFHLQASTLQAEIICVSYSTIDDVFSCEQFIHQHPKNACFRVWNNREFGGHSEFYQMTTKTAIAKFANCQRTSNKLIGFSKLFCKNGTRRQRFNTAEGYELQQLKHIYI